MFELTEPQMRALKVVEAGDCWQRRGGGVNQVRLDVLLRLMAGGYVRWERPSDLVETVAIPDLTGKAFLTDRGREVLADA
jgi:hypothetical protein